MQNYLTERLMATQQICYLQLNKVTADDNIKQWLHMSKLEISETCTIRDNTDILQQPIFQIKKIQYHMFLFKMTAVDHIFMETPS